MQVAIRAPKSLGAPDLRFGAALAMLIYGLALRRRGTGKPA